MIHWILLHPLPSLLFGLVVLCGALSFLGDLFEAINNNRPRFPNEWWRKRRVK